LDVSRDKQIANRAQGDGQARSLSNLQITVRYLDPGYEIIQHDMERGDTGLLRVFSLIPKAADKRAFHARVDDGNPGNRRNPELDIDISSAPNEAVRDFKSNRNGYAGHHTNRSLDSTHRVFDVDIAVPQGRIFDGEVSFNASFSVAVPMTMSASLTADATVIRASRMKRFRIRIAAFIQKALGNICNPFR
jgi:hypothetical protein